ncbi:hypothetical protein ACFQJD_09970 [Haloplanus sp. GCM10025708]|uniref:hypothetical protein n=1 Tax=Haloferacaceae TaxID=1644056 RepID=UPI00360BEF32
MSQLTTADEIALYLGGGLVLLGTVGVGLLEMIAGSPHPVSGEGQIVHEALVPLHIRSYIILLGLAIWGAYAVYKVVATTPETGQTRRTL